MIGFKALGSLKGLHRLGVKETSLVLVAVAAAVAGEAARRQTVSVVARKVSKRRTSVLHSFFLAV